MGNYNELRQKAEAWLSKIDNQSLKDISDEVKLLMHELNVHQVELEMQNEELRAAQVELEVSRTKYRELFDFAPIGYFSIDEKSRIKEVNFTGCTYLGIERKYLINSLLFTYIAPGYLNPFNKILLKTLESDRKHTAEIKLYRKDNSELFVSIESIAIETANGRQCLIALTDITTRKNAEANLRRLNEVLETRIHERTSQLTDINIKLKTEISEREKTELQLIKILSELQRSNKELEEFAYVTSHDLQEPLRMIASFTALLSKKIPDDGDPDTKEFMDFIIDAALRMQQLINGILSISRVATRGSEFRNFNSENSLKNAVENLRTSIHNSQAVITYGALPEIFADPIQIEQLFQNLISNAIKYSGDKPPEIYISSKKGVDEWIFSVKDNGIGINPEFHERIFKIFQRLHTRNEYDGIGIGLSICSKIIQRHKGSIWVESEEGKGSEFFFTIPIQP